MLQLLNLQWLPVRQRVTFILACLLHQTLSGHAPAYLADACIQLPSEVDRRQLCSSATRTCTVTATEVFLSLDCVRRTESHRPQ